MIPRILFAMGMLGCLLGGSAGCSDDEISPGVPSAACVTVADCSAPAAPECQSAACLGGACVYTNQVEGTLVDQQVEGDCSELQCDGAGAAHAVPSATDTPDDGHPCTLDSCDDGAPVHTLQASLPCYSGPQGTAGQGLCAEGIQACDADGELLGGCVGEVIPTTETCNTPGDDEDCDGAVASCAGDHLWSKRFGDIYEDHGTAVALDGSGNIVTTGHFAGAVDFGGGALISAGDVDIFLAKLGPDGNHLWSKRFGDSEKQDARQVAVDGAGNALVIGEFSGAVDFGGGILTSAGDADIFFAKLDPDGNHLWSQRFGSAGYDAGGAVVVDDAGNVTITGLFSGAVDLGGGDLISAGSTDIFIARYDAGGSHLWSKRFGGAEYDTIQGAAVDDAGNLVFTGPFVGSIDFGGGALISAAKYDIFVAKLDADGNHLWSMRAGDSGFDLGYGVAVDSGNNVVVCGFFEDTINLGGGDLSSSGGPDMFLMKLDADGDHLWSKVIGGADTDYCIGLAVGGADQAVITGLFGSTVDFGGGDLTAQGFDNFVAKYDTDGNHLWSKQSDSGGQGLGSGVDVAVDDVGQVVATGYFAESADLGGGDLVSAGDTDIYLAKYAP